MFCQFFETFVADYIVSLHGHNKKHFLLIKRKEKYKKIPKRDFLKKLPSKKGFITDNHSVIKPF